MIGLNFPADARLSSQFGALMGSDWLRVVLKPEFDLNAWLNDVHGRGMKGLGVIARESLYAPDATPDQGAGRLSYPEWLESIANASGMPSESAEMAHEAMSYNDAAQFYSERYGDKFDAIQAGNEADHVSPSSWTMTPDDLNSLLYAVNMHFPKSIVVGPGLVSGHPHYLDAVDLDLVDAIAVHPYGQRPYGCTDDWAGLPGNFGTVTDLLASYAYHNKPIWVTEVGLSTTECSHDMQARYCEAILKTLQGVVPVAFWFCADDAMVPEFGLYDDQGRPKPSAAAFIRASGGAHPEPSDGPTFQLGFGKWAAIEPDLLGRPLKNERNTGFAGWQIQPTSTGVLQWHANDGHIFVTHDGRVFRWTEGAPGSEEVPG
jgi:hypothetical protein